MNQKHLPYYLPKNQKDQLTFLAESLNIPRHMVINGDNQLLETMCGVMIYRHLDVSQKIEVMKLIRTYKGSPLEGKLIESAILPTINPQWGIWSLTNEELKKDAEYHAFLDSIANYVGATASGMAVKDLAEKTWKLKKIGRGSIATIVIWAAILFNQSELNKANTEISRRKSSMKTSKFY